MRRGERPERWEVWALVVLAAYFAGRVVYFAAAIAPGIPPDEPTHVGLIELYSQAPLLIQDSPASYRHGLVTRVPFLYHMALGKLLWLLGSLPLDRLLLLRLLNGALALGTLAAGYGLALRLTDSAVVRLLFATMASNTLMLTFLAGAVSYDNLANLLAVLSLTALMDFLDGERPTALLAFALWSLLGTLTKISLLPLTALLLLILLFERRRRLADDLARMARRLGEGRPAPVLLAAVAAVALAANLWLYGGNLMRYGKPVPTCDQVLELEACLENRIFARGWILGQYRRGELSFEEALRATRRIDHPSDRAHTVRLLDNERAYQQSRSELLPAWDYMALVWSRAMKPTLFGIQAHASMLKDPGALLPYNLVLFAAFLLWVRGVGSAGSERRWLYLGLVALLYFAFLVGVYNYRAYLTTHAPFLGVQGRYLLPVLVPAYLVAARFLLRPFPRPVQITLALTVGALFIWGDLPFFLRHASGAWFGPAGGPGGLTGGG